MKKNDTIGIGHFLHQENPKGLFQLLISSISSNRYLQNPQAGQTVGIFRKDVSPPDAPTSHVANVTYRSLMLVMLVSADRLLRQWFRPIPGTIGFQLLISYSSQTVSETSDLYPKAEQIYERDKIQE